MDYDQAVNEIEADREKIRALEQWRDDLTHLIVHDLKNPLAGILASVELFEGGYLGETNPDQQRALANVSLGLKKLSGYLGKRKINLHLKLFY